MMYGYFKQFKINYLLNFSVILHYKKRTCSFVKNPNVGLIKTIL